MRQPKLGGFKNPNKVEFEVVNLADLEELKAGKYDAVALREAKLLRTKKPVKILGKGEVTKKYIEDENHYVECSISVEDPGGEKPVTGIATIILPARDV